MANSYGLVTDFAKFGTGSLYAPYNTSLTKRFRINPATGNNFSIASGEDFYISVWIKYGSLNVGALNTQYPIIKYGDTGTGWEIGYRVQRVGDGNNPSPYFQFNGTRLTTTFNGSNGGAISPSNNFDHYEIYRQNGVIHFNFTNYPNGSTTAWTTATYTGAIAANLSAATVANGITLGSTQPVITSAGAVNGAWIDQLYFARGISSPITLLDGVIRDGDNPNTVFLYNFNGNYLDDTSGIKQGSANLTATTSLTGVDVIYEGTTAPLQSRFTVNATATRVGSNLPMVATTLQSRFTITKAYGGERQRAQASLTASLTASATALKRRQLTANLAATFRTQTTASRYYPRPWSNWTSTTNVSAYPGLANWTRLEVSNLLLTSYSGTGSVNHTLFSFGGQSVVRNYQTGPTRNFITIAGVQLDISGITPTGGQPVVMKLVAVRGQAVQLTIGASTYTFGIWDHNPVTQGTIFTNLTAIGGLALATNNYANELLVTKATYNSSQLLSSNPHEFSDQTGILLNYHTISGPDDTGINAQFDSQRLSASTSLQADGQRVTLARATLAVNSALTAKANYFVRSNRGALQVTSTQTAKPLRIKKLASGLQVTSSITSSGRRIFVPPASLSSTTAIATTAKRTASAQANLQVLASELTLDTAVKRARASLSSQAVLTSTPIKDTGSFANLSASSTMTTRARAIKPVALTLSDTTTQNATAKKIARVSITLQALASELTLANYQVRSDMARLEARASLSCDPFVIGWNATRCEIESTLTADVNYLTQSFEVNALANSSIYTNGGKIRFGVAHLQAFASELVFGSKISVDPYLQLVIAQETRNYLIYSEDRQLDIDQDNRTYLIESENRLLAVNPENGVNIIQG